MKRNADSPWGFVRTAKARTLLHDISSSGMAESPDGEAVELAAGLDARECGFLHRLIRRNPVHRTLEIGCAHGISTVSICDALHDRSDSFHTAIDLTQSGYWRSIGVANVKRCGFERFELIEEDSACCLPRMAAEGRKFDFVLIDGWHSFDHALMDFFFANRMLEPGGIVVFDDAANRSINKVVRYVEKYPCYRRIACISKTSWTKRRRIAHAGRTLARCAVALVPRPVVENLFDAAAAEYDKTRENASLVAFRKVAEDKRDFWWCPHF